MPTSIVPPGMTRLPRYVLFPYGPHRTSFTLALYGAGFGVTAYRLTMREAGKSRPIFAGTVQTHDRQDWIAIAGEIIKAVSVRPGDTPGEDSATLTPEQLEVVLHHGPALRAAAARRFGWTPAESKPLRADLEATLTSRATSRGKRTHAATIGVVHAEGPTKRAALVALREGIVNHVSSVPVFRASRDLTRVIALYPVGSRFDAVELHPGRQDPIGVRHALPAKDMRAALDALEALANPKPARRSSSGLFAKVHAPVARARTGRA